ncbi:MAG: hypothetical protein WAV90_25650 [Gordonia amarae]
MGASGSNPLSVDIDLLHAKTLSFQGFVELGRANNNRLMAISDTAHVANVGELSNSFQLWLADVHSTALHNNQVYDQITQALNFGKGTTTMTDADAANLLRGLTGIATQAGTGTHFA